MLLFQNLLRSFRASYASSRILWIVGLLVLLLLLGVVAGPVTPLLLLLLVATTTLEGDDAAEAGPTATTGDLTTDTIA